MKVAVIMSTYNGQEFLEQQIDSILAQEGVDVELFIRDDGSSDQTPSILSDYAARCPQVHAVLEENIGFRQSFIRELGRHPGFDLYAFSDQDDLWKPDKLARGCQAVSELAYAGRPVLYHSNLQIADRDLNVLGRTHLERRRCSLGSAVMRRSIAGCTMVFDRRLWLAVFSRPHHPDLFLRGHDSFLVSLCYALGGIVVCGPEARILYRQHESNGSGGSPRSFRARLRKEWRSLTEKRGQEARMAAALLERWDTEMTPSARKTLELVAGAGRHWKQRALIAAGSEFSTGDLRLTLAGKARALLSLL